MAFLLALRGTPVCTLLKELTEEQMSLFCKLSSEVKEEELVRGPGLCTKERKAPFFYQGLKGRWPGLWASSPAAQALRDCGFLWPQPPFLAFPEGPQDSLLCMWTWGFH